MNRVLKLLVSNLDSTHRWDQPTETWKLPTVIPAQAGIQSRRLKRLWIPAFAGMTVNWDSNDMNYEYHDSSGCAV